MKLLRWIALAVAIAGALPARAQDRGSVRAFLNGIYAAYRHGSKGVTLDRPDRWFDAELARAMRSDTDTAAKRNEVGALDGDPFCDCQDFIPFNAKISGIKVAPGKAVAEVHFQNGRPVALRYELVWTKAGWRISDIVGADGDRLRGLFLKDR